MPGYVREGSVRRRQRQEQRLEQTRDKWEKWTRRWTCRRKRGWMLGIETEKGKARRKRASNIEIWVQGESKSQWEEATRNREREYEEKGSDSSDYDGQWMQPSLEYAPLSPWTTCPPLAPSQNSRSAINVYIVARACIFFVARIRMDYIAINLHHRRTPFLFFFFFVAGIRVDCSIVFCSY